MRTTIILITVLVSLFKVVAADEPFINLEALFKESDASTNAVPNCIKAPEIVRFRILAEDVLQDSVQRSRMSTGQFAVRWTYTEAGAKKMLAFREAHEGMKVQYLFGNYETRPAVWTFHPTQLSTNYTQFKERWLERRGETVCCETEPDAKIVAVALKGE